MRWIDFREQCEHEELLMDKKNRRVIYDKDEVELPRRRYTIYLLGAVIPMPLAACNRRRKNTRSFAIFDVEMFSYVDRVVVDVMFNGTSLGVMNKFGGTGLITGVRIPFGSQTLTYTLGGPEGVVRENKRLENTLFILPERVPLGTQAIGLHLYPDNTAEITFSESIPARTARGEKIWADKR
jgi:hypothetical protein